jgi:hypothetical protein
MSVIQKFEYTWPSGAEQIQFHPWVATLTQAEQDEFAQALARQEAFRQQYIDDGSLTLVPDGYEWKDESALSAGKPMDATWQVYWQRWIDATGVQFSYSVL